MGARWRRRRLTRAHACGARTRAQLRLAPRVLAASFGGRLPPLDQSSTEAAGRNSTKGDGRRSRGRSAAGGDAYAGLVPSGPAGRPRNQGGRPARKRRDGPRPAWRYSRRLHRAPSTHLVGGARPVWGLDGGGVVSPALAPTALGRGLSCGSLRESSLPPSEVELERPCRPGTSSNGLPRKQRRAKRGGTPAARPV